MFSRLAINVFSVITFLTLVAYSFLPVRCAQNGRRYKKHSIALSTSACPHDRLHLFLHFFFVFSQASLLEIWK